MDTNKNLSRVDSIRKRLTDDQSAQPTRDEVDYLLSQLKDGGAEDFISRKEAVERIERQIRLWNNDTVTMACADMLAEIKTMGATTPTESAATEQAGEQRPKIICLCGSTRFMQTWIDEYQRLSDEGNIVLTVARMPPRPNLQHDEPELKQRLDELHLRKIDLADEVFVLDVGGYIGSSTKREIEYAVSKDKPVWYFSATAPAPSVAQPEADLRNFDWALRELADGWISNNEREGEYGFYQNARRVLELIVADSTAEVSRLNSEVERLRKYEREVSTLRVGYTLEKGLAKTFQKRIASARADAIGACIERIKAERLHEDLGNESDQGYQNAIEHMVEALEQLKESNLSEPRV